MALDFKGGQVRIDGLDAAVKVLGKLPGKVEKSVLASATRAMAQVVRKEAESRAPVRSSGEAKKLAGQLGKTGIRRTPGYLKRSIVVTRLKRASGRKQAVYIVKPHPSAFYGMFAEFGTSTQSARPWLRPAMDASYSAAFAKFRQVLGRRIEKEIAKLAGPAVKKRRR